MTNKRTSVSTSLSSTGATTGGGAATSSSSRGSSRPTTPMPVVSSSLSSSVLLPPPPPPPPATATTTMTTTVPRTGRSILYKVDWNSDLEFKFLRSFFGEGGQCFRPIGLNKHFSMLVAYDRFRRIMNRNVDIECLWAKLERLYDIDYIDEMEEETNRKNPGGISGGGHYNLPPCLFPPGGGSTLPEFELPDDVFGSEKIMRMTNNKSAAAGAAGGSGGGGGSGGPKVKKRRII